MSRIVIDMHDDSALETLLHNINNQRKTPLIVCDGVGSMDVKAMRSKVSDLLIIPVKFNIDIYPFSNYNIITIGGN